MVISFKDRFKEAILSGTKIHTIREDKHDRWKKGMKMNMATGVRTRNYNEFAEKNCTGTQKISIRYFDNKSRVEVVINDRYIGAAYFGIKRIYCCVYELEILAHNDGFDSVDDFFAWFNKDFEGKIIHWTDFRY